MSEKQETSIEDLAGALKALGPVFTAAAQIFEQQLTLQREMNGVVIKIRDAIKDDKALRLTRKETKTLALMLAALDARRR